MQPCNVYFIVQITLLLSSQDRAAFISDTIYILSYTWNIECIIYIVKIDKIIEEYTCSFIFIGITLVRVSELASRQCCKNRMFSPIDGKIMID